MGNQDDLSKGVRALLLREWDPVGVGSEKKAADEYDTYVPQISGMILRGDTAATLARYLLQVERVQMGLPGNEGRARSVAAALISLKQQ